MDSKGHGSIVVINDNVSFDGLADYLVTAPGRENKEDGFYMMNMDKVIEKYQKWVELLPRVRPFYAMKCNPDPMLVRLLSKLGTGFDCASKAEITIAIKCGSNPQDIIYAHTCKKTSYIRFAAQCGVSKMTFDSESELHKIEEAYPDSEILLRFLPTSPMLKYDVNRLKFGAPFRDCNKLLTTAKNMGLNVVGVSFFIGCDFYDASPFRDAIDTAKAIFEIGKKIGFSFRILDIGGGFPGKEQKVSFEKICEMVNSALDEHFPVSSGVNIIAEPGKYFATSPYILVSNITTVKEVNKFRLEDIDKENPPVPFTEEGPETGYMYYIDDGLFNSFLNLKLEDYLIYVTPKPLKANNISYYPSSVLGQSCAFLDWVNKNCMLPKLSVSDWLYFDNQGAYSLSLSSGFNGFPSELYTYYFVTKKTWEAIQSDMRDFHGDIIKPNLVN